MTVAILEAPINAVKADKVTRYCVTCNELIIKRPTESARVYAKRKYCNQKCLGIAIEQRQLDRVEVKRLADNTILPIGKYLEEQTENGKLQASFWLGVMREVESHENKEGVDRYCIKCKSKFEDYYYKGIQVTAELAKSAADWLTMNTFGRYGQRRAPDEKPKRTEDELRSRFRFQVKKLFPKNSVRILELMEGEGL